MELMGCCVGLMESNQQQWEYIGNILGYNSFYHMVIEQLAMKIH